MKKAFEWRIRMAVQIESRLRGQLIYLRTILGTLKGFLAVTQIVGDLRKLTLITYFLWRYQYENHYIGNNWMI
jgi:hypothetical protein